MDYSILEQSADRLHGNLIWKPQQAMDTSILLVDDDRDFLEIIRRKLVEAGFNRIRVMDNPQDAAEYFGEGKTVDIALIDMTMPEMDGIILLEILKANSPRTECIMVTAVNEARVAVDCIKKGAYDYLVKPVAQDDLIFAINRTLERKRLLDILDIEKGKTRLQLVRPKPFAPIVTRSTNVLRVLKEAELHANSNVAMLITGESGTGKELLARAIHQASPRAPGTFTPVNMASVSPGLFESEFFGYTRGAFTGADNNRAGYLEHTSGGTLFLDEIGNLPMDMQGKLLRVLQDGEYTKVGSDTFQKADIRIIAATNADLDGQMNKGLFRKDLYYRIRGGWLHLPPLRDRKSDIPLLCEFFLNENHTQGRTAKINDEAMCVLMEYDFPGNIRELKAIIQSSANLASGESITLDCLPENVRKKRIIADCSAGANNGTIEPLALIEKRHILRAYRQTGGNKSKTARLLGIGLNTLRRKLRIYREV